MKLKCLVISDTHVGEPNSLLSFPRGLQELWYAIRTQFVDDGKDPLVTPVEVEDLILLGDIPDRTLSSTSQIQTQTAALVRTLISAVKPKRVVYVIGNHDHTLWTNYLAGTPDPPKGVWGITKAQGVNIIDPVLGRHQDPKTEELLGTFFEYPYGSSWNGIVEGFATDSPLQFVLANPLYARELNNRMYVFTHGTYFRPDVCLTQATKDFIAKTHLASLLAGLHLDAGGDVRNAVNLSDYERRVHAFIDTLWPSAGNNPLTKADELWVLRRHLRIGVQAKRECPRETARIAWSDLKNHPKRVKALCGDPASSVYPDLRHGNLNRLQDGVLRHLLNYVSDEVCNLTTKEGLTFVYGDTHEGGFAEVSVNLANLKMVTQDSPQTGGKKIDMHMVNTGAWLVEAKDRHPPCHLFAVDEDGGEHLLDVSYKDIRVGEDLVLELAEMQVDQRLERVGDTADKIAGWVTSILA